MRFMQTCAIVCTAAATMTAGAQSFLYGLTASGGFVEIDPATGVAGPELFSIGAGGRLTYEPFSDRYVALDRSTEPPSLTVISRSGAVTTTGPIAGLPAGQEQVGGLGYSGFPGTLLITFGPTGGVIEDRIAIMTIDGLVAQTTLDLGLGDNDNVVWDAANARTLVTDYNANDGFERVSRVDGIFFIPTTTPILNPPSDGSLGDSTVDPTTGTLLTTRFDDTGGELVAVGPSAYTTIGAYGTADQIVGIAFGPRVACSIADLVEPFGIVDLDDADAFINAFIASDPIADVAPLFGIVDLDDADAFINAFFQSCP